MSSKRTRLKLKKQYTVTDNRNMSFSTHRVEFAQVSLPVIQETRSKDWVQFGINNLFPQEIERMVLQSPTQMSIIKSKAGMMAGECLLVNESKTIDESSNLLKTLPSEIQTGLATLISNELDEMTLEEIIGLISYDYMMFGAFALEVIWSLDHTKIVCVKYVKVANVRSGFYGYKYDKVLKKNIDVSNNRINDYYYSRDWNYYTKTGFVPQPIAAFNIEDKSTNQLIYVKNGTLEYYGLPSWISGISYVEMEGSLANFGLSGLKNGWNPGMAIMIPEKPGSPEEEYLTVEGLKKQYGGTGNTNSAMVMFYDGAENEPKVVPTPTSNIDKLYVSQDALASQKILTANQVTSPLLVGISTPGQLGGNTELATAYQILNKSVISPDRKQVEKTLNKILKINNVGAKLSILEFNPLVNSNVVDTGNSVNNALSALSPLVANKVLESMTADEIRDLVNLPPKPIEVVQPIVEQPTVITPENTTPTI